jgi:hypothetical protein
VKKESLEKESIFPTVRDNDDYILKISSQELLFSSSFSGQINIPF